MAKRKTKDKPAGPPPAREPEHGWCEGCGGQLTKTFALNLKNAHGGPLPYVSCPGDCNGNTRRDLNAAPRR